MNYREFPIWKSIHEGRIYKESLPASIFIRLGGAVENVLSPVTFSLRGEVDNVQGQKTLIGDLEVELSLVCQRCLEPYTKVFNLPLYWIPIRKESDQEKVGDGENILLIPEETTDLLELLEDEILLALPLVPKHGETQDCSGRVILEALAPQEEEVRQPFAELAELFKK